jgi:hypothetical protein
MSRTAGCIALALWAVVAGALAQEIKRPARSPLTKPQREALEGEVLPAIERQSDSALVTALAPLVARISDVHLAAIDEYLAERKQPPVAVLLADARVRLVEQNLQTQAPPPKARELALTLRGLKTRLDEVLALYRTAAAFDEQAAAPQDLTEFEARFWDHHVLENRLAAAGRMARFAQQLVEESRKQSTRSLTAEDKEVLEADYQMLLSNLASMNRELGERTMSLRVKRLEHAAGVVGKTSDLKEKFLAAYVIDLDGELLAGYFKQLHGAAAPANAPPATSSGEILFCKHLADAALPARIEQLRDGGRQSAGEEFLTKSRQLFTGLHWWFRGRYGLGSEGHGLLKSKQALASPDAMFGLYMPIKSPLPTDPTRPGSPVPLVDRRHHYLWQFETRSISVSVDADSKRSSSQDLVSITKTDYFY